MPYSFEMQRKVSQPAPLSKQWSIEEKESILDYLHGYVGDDEVKAVCYYEFGRHSETLRKARREYNAADPDNSLLTVSNYFPAWVLDPTRFCFLQCREFPDSAWRDLSKEDREHIRLLFKPISPRPIITDVLMLRGTGVFDAFSEQAENALNDFNQRLAPPKPAKERKKPTKRVVQPAMVGVQPFIKHVVITVDYRGGVDSVKEQFARWLGSERNQKLFKDHYKRPIHKQNPDSPDRYKELLKYLAAWRLYDELDFKGAKEWTKQNRRERKDALRHKKFFRERPTQIVGREKYFFGPLYAGERDWEYAIAKAESFLRAEFFERPEKNAGRSAAGKKYREALAAERQRGLT